MKKIIVKSSFEDFRPWSFAEEKYNFLADRSTPEALEAAVSELITHDHITPPALNDIFTHYAGIIALKLDILPEYAEVFEVDAAEELAREFESWRHYGDFMR